MNSFVNAVKTPAAGSARTTNAMKAYSSTGSACVDLFYKIGAMRGQNVIPVFEKAYVENREVALRIALWVRDIRGGAGERQIFRDILTHLEKNVPEDAKLLMRKTPEVGRWDDILVFKNALQEDAARFYAEAILQGDRLASKWAPRKGATAITLAKAMDATPKQYRKAIVNGSDTVETDMCARNWDAIDFSHVPSIASKKYRKAFAKHAPEKYVAWVEALKRKEVDPTVKEKVNASAIFPHDIVRSIRVASSKVELDAVVAQWNALPNYIGDNKVLAITDTSGSMFSVLDKSGLMAIDVAVSLGLYCADKNTGPFKDMFCQFSGTSKLEVLKGNLIQKVNQLSSAHWGMDTNLHAAFENILNVAKSGNAKPEDMPGTVLILSDMQFNGCVRYDDSAMEMIERKYREAGYKVPAVVFWNINAYNNAPVSVNKHGVALVSGYSPAIAKSILTGLEDMTPEGVMLKTIMVDRYNPF